MTKKGSTVTIVGCGIAGNFLAIMLANQGYKVALYERLPKKDICDVASKRSYNITIYGYAIEKLKEKKLWEYIEPYLLPLAGSQTQIENDTKPIYSPTHKNMPYYSVARARLVEILLAVAEKSSLITIHYETTLVSINHQKKTMLVKKEHTNEKIEVPCDVIIGADGVNSTVRPLMQLSKQTNHTQEYADWSYKQFIISKENANLLNLRQNIAYTWIRKQTVILAFPNTDGSFAAMFLLPKGENGFSSLASHQRIEHFFKQNYPIFTPILPDIIPSLLSNPEGRYVTIHTDPWYYKDFITIIGDAAHGFYPFFGQGTSAAFGDAIKLITLLDTYGTDWEKIFPLYQEERKKDMDALGELSKKALIQYMRTKRADYTVVYEKLESIGNLLLPKLISPPVYLQVFNDPDHTADYVKKSIKQRRILNRFGLSFIAALITQIIALFE